MSRYAPWYEVLRRLALVIPTLVFRWLFLLCVWLGWGRSAAEQVERDTR
jgi:hypothetical protein